MTLASSGPLTSAEINTETGEATFDMNGTEERNLAGRSSGEYSWSDYWGQTKDGLCTEQGLVFGTTSSGTYTSTACDIGAEAWNRRVVACVHWACGTSAVETTISSGTIGGVAISIHLQTGEGGTSALSNYGCAIISATVPTGTDAVFVLTFTNATVRTVLLTAYRVTGLTDVSAFNVAAAYDEDIVAPSAYSAQALLDIPSGTEGLAFYAATASSAGNLSNMTTTGISEQQENSISPDGRCSSGFQMNLSTQTNRPVTTSGTALDASRLRLVTASFLLA